MTVMKKRPTKPCSCFKCKGKFVDPRTEKGHAIRPRYIYIAPIAQQVFSLSLCLSSLSRSRSLPLALALSLSL